MAVTVKVYASPGVDRALVDSASQAIADHLGLRVAYGGPLAVPASALDNRRGQYDASAVLGQIPVPQSGELALGIVDVDMYVCGLNFVFGLASGRRAVISTARLRAPGRPEIERHRVGTEAVHEIGHLLGLRHCRDPRCAMFFSNTLADTDAKGPGLCEKCRRLLARVLDMERGEAEG